MTKFRCNTCKHLSVDFCNKLKEGLPNDLAKLFYGGAVGLYSGAVTYPSMCGIEKNAEAEKSVFVSERLTQELPTMQTTPTAEAQSKESVNQINAI